MADKQSVDSQTGLSVRHEAPTFLKVCEATGPLAEVWDVVKVPEAVLVFAGEHAGLPGGREGGEFGGELLIEVTDVCFAADGGHEGRGHLSLQQRLPVHILNGDGEEEMKNAWVMNKNVLIFLTSSYICFQEPKKTTEAANSFFRSLLSELTCARVESVTVPPTLLFMNDFANLLHKW